MTMIVQLENKRPLVQYIENILHQSIALCCFNLIPNLQLMCQPWFGSRRVHRIYSYMVCKTNQRECRPQREKQKLHKNNNFYLFRQTENQQKNNTFYLLRQTENQQNNNSLYLLRLIENQQKNNSFYLFRQTENQQKNINFYLLRLKETQQNNNTFYLLRLKENRLIELTTCRFVSPSKPSLIVSRFLFNRSTVA